MYCQLRIALLTTAVVFAGSVARASDDRAEAYGLPLMQRVLADDEMSKLARDAGVGTEEEEQAAKKEILNSNETLEILAWLADYAQASAHSAPDDLRKFREKLNDVSAAELQLLLFRLQQERARRRSAHVASLRLRQQAWSMNYQAAGRSSTRPTAPTTRNHSGAMQSHLENNPYRPLPVVRRRRGYRARRPLVTSRDIARIEIYRAIFPRWRW